MNNVNHIVIGKTYFIQQPYGGKIVERTVICIDEKRNLIIYRKGNTENTGMIDIKSFIRYYNRDGVQFAEVG